MSKKDKRQPYYGAERLTVWPITGEDESSTIYGTANHVSHSLVSVSDTPETSENPFYADDILIVDAKTKSGGKLAIAVSDLFPEERSLFYGESIKNSSNIMNANDITGFSCIAYKMKCHDGSVKLKKYPRCIFSEGAESTKTMEKDKIQYVTIALNGSYHPRLDNGDARYILSGVFENTPEGKIIIEKWFTDADYYGPDDVPEAPPTVE